MLYKLQKVFCFCLPQSWAEMSLSQALFREPELCYFLKKTDCFLDSNNGQTLNSSNKLQHSLLSGFSLFNLT